MDSIKLNDILKLENLDNVKIRFNLMFSQEWNPIEIFKSGDYNTMLQGQYWNYTKKKSFKKGQLTIGLLKIKPSCLLYTSPSPRDKRQSRMPSSA